MGLNCPTCKNKLVEIDEEKGYWQCPFCGGYWLPQLAFTGEIKQDEIFLAWLDEQEVKRKMAKKRGGGNKSGRFKNKKEVPFVPWYQRDIQEEEG